jgi:hypothetical protein
MVLAKQLRDIFVAKYLPVLSRISGVEVSEGVEAVARLFPTPDLYKWLNEAPYYEVSTFAFLIKAPAGKKKPKEEIYVVFSTRKSKGKQRPVTLVGIRWVGHWYIDGATDIKELKSEHWKVFYGRLNELVSRLIARAVAKRFPKAQWWSDSRAVRLPDRNTKIYFKFTLRQLYITFQSGWGKEIETGIELPEEGDIVESLVKAIVVSLI